MDIDAAMSLVQGAVVESLSRAELDGVVARLRQIRSWCDAVEVRVSRRARELAEAPEQVVGEHGRRPVPETRRAVAREEACTTMPSFEQALAASDITAGHVDALAAAVSGVSDPTRAAVSSYEAALVAAAKRQTVAEFERSARELVRQIEGQQIHASDAERLDEQRKRSRVKRWVDTVTGMHHTHVELDPVRDETFWTAVQAQLGCLRQQDGNRLTPFTQLEIDAVVTAASAGQTGERLPEISILLDYLTLLHGLHPYSVCETVAGVQLPVSTARRLCCDATIIPIVLSGNSEILDLGRELRTCNRAQRRALRARHRSCAHPDCTVTFDACRLHHVRWWWKDLGPTDLDNLLPLCEQHHHLVHEGGWTLTLTPDRTATWTRPDGTTYHHSPTTNRQPDPITQPHTRPAPVGVGS